MFSVEYLRSFRIGGYAVFDFAISYLGVYLLSPILIKLFKKLGKKVSLAQLMYLVLPVSILTHVLTGQDTLLTRQFLDLYGYYLVKLVILGMVYKGLGGKGVTKKKRKIDVVKTLFGLWGGCIVLLAVSVGVATKWFSGTVNDTSYGNSEFFLVSTIILIFLGFLFFGTGVLVGLLKKKGKLWLVFKFLIFLSILLVWFSSYPVAIKMAKVQLGFITTPNSVLGTGSMYPTFPKGQGKSIKEQSKEIVATPEMFPYPNGLVLFGKRYFNHEIGRGDIVTFFNQKTKEITQRDTGEEHGFIKRVIAMAGDRIELREGIVYLNSQPQKEAYIAKARSTFGGEFLSECKVLTVPDNKLFVMGDNRKGSGDSRYELGLVDIGDVDRVIPWKKQFGSLDVNWRDPANDLEESAKIRLDVEKYLEILNQKRKEAGVQLLRIEPRLETSAGKRGEVILKFDDFSFEATRSGYTMSQAMAEAGYSNIVWGEAPTLGYYEAEELLENQFEFPWSRKFLLQNDYQDIGIAEVEGEINGCPTQVIVQQFAGYVPPNYQESNIESWEQSLSSLREILPSWENIRTAPNLYKNNRDKSERIIQIINLRISRIDAVVMRMKANQWLSKEEIRFTEEDIGLYNEQDELAEFLNSVEW